MTEIAVMCRNIRKQYGPGYALNDLTLSIPGGRVTGILGPNGAGKSTLFRLLTGLTRADSGEVTVFGKSPGWQTNADIAYLPDRARWYGDHKVHEAFRFAEEFLPGFDRALAEKLAALMKVNMDMRVSGMSRGQEARLMLILCIARRVPLTILDEPFAGIDVISREKIIEGLIEHMNDGNRTVLISTHEVYEAEGLFDYSVFLNEGQVVLSGVADDLRKQYGSMHSTLNYLFQ